MRFTARTRRGLYLMRDLLDQHGCLITGGMDRRATGELMLALQWIDEQRSQDEARAERRSAPHAASGSVSQEAAP